MEEIMNYVNPELLVLVPVLYFVGEALKKHTVINTAWIPAINGLLGIVLAALYIIATSELTTYQSVAMAVFTAIVQGIIVSGLATYGYELIKNTGKLRKGE